jgi:hypothetical protein
MALKSQKKASVVQETPKFAIEGGRIDYIAADAFRVDMSYQRPADEARINKLAKNWNPGGLGVVIASYRDEKLNLLDGQHRVGALKRLGEKTTLVPTLILEGLTVADEAEFFVLMNKNRRALMPSELFHASLAEGDEGAIEIKTVIDRYGLTLNSYGAEPTNIRGVAAIWSIYNSMGIAGLDASIGMCIQAWGRTQGSFSAPVIKAVARVLHYNEGNIKMDRLRNALANNTPQVWMDRASQLRTMNGGDRIVQMATSMAEAYNKGLGTTSHLDVKRMNQKKDSFKESQKLQRNRKAS